MLASKQSIDRSIDQSVHCMLWGSGWIAGWNTRVHARKFNLNFSAYIFVLGKEIKPLVEVAPRGNDATPARAEKP
jgi:hypothetical protein